MSKTGQAESSSAQLGPRVRKGAENEMRGVEWRRTEDWREDVMEKKGEEGMAQETTEE